MPWLMDLGLRSAKEKKYLVSSFAFCLQLSSIIFYLYFDENQKGFNRNCKCWLAKLALSKVIISWITAGLCGIYFNESSYYFDEFKRKLVLRKDAIPQVHTGHAENSTPVLGELEVDDTETNDIITVVSDCEMERIIETNAVEETAIEITNDNLLINNDFLLRTITLDHSYAAKPDDYFTLRNENHKLKSNFKKAQRKSILCISKLMQSNKKKSKELLAMSLKLRKLRSNHTRIIHRNAKEIFKNELRNRKRLPKNREFSKRLVDIAYIQKFHSNSVYENLRRIFSFPCPRTLRRKTEKIDCSPGYQENIFKQTQQQITKNLLDSNCIMSLDEMAIHKGLRSWH